MKKFGIIAGAVLLASLSQAQVYKYSNGGINDAMCQAADVNQYVQGFSSGNLNAASVATTTAGSQRWMAQAVSFKQSTTISNVWLTGFLPAGSAPLNIKVKMWSRAGTAPYAAPASRPVPGTEVAAGSGIGAMVAGGNDQRGLGVDGSSAFFVVTGTRFFDITLAAPITVPAGEYWFTAYADGYSDTLLDTSSNFAWFGGSPGGYENLEAPVISSPVSAGANYRSSVYPGTASQGFLTYSINTTIFPVRDIMEYKDRWNLDFTLIGPDDTTDFSKKTNIVNGWVILPGFTPPAAGSAAGTRLRMEFANGAGTLVARRDADTYITDTFLTVNADLGFGDGPQDYPLFYYEVPAPAGGPYNLTIKGDGYLASAISTPLATEAGDVNLTGPTGEIAVLIPGDADDDNAVTILDYSLLSDFFDKTSGDADYFDIDLGAYSNNRTVPAAVDFDSDGAISILDYSLLSTFFDLSGDPMQTELSSRTFPAS